MRESQLINCSIQSKTLSLWKDIVHRQVSQQHIRLQNITVDCKHQLVVQPDQTVHKGFQLTWR